MPYWARTFLAQFTALERNGLERPLPGLPALGPVLSPSRITLENNGKIRPQPDGENTLSGASGGSGGIRTHGTVPRTLVFKTRALNHSATLPIHRSGSETKQALDGRRLAGRSAGRAVLITFRLARPALAFGRTARGADGRRQQTAAGGRPCRADSQRPRCREKSAHRPPPPFPLARPTCMI